MNTLIELVAEGGRIHDRRPALLIRPGFRTRVWRYRDLADVVPRAARVLRDAGLGKGDRYIVWAVNRPEWSVGWLLRRDSPTSFVHCHSFWNVYPKSSY